VGTRRYYGGVQWLGLSCWLSCSAIMSSFFFLAESACVVKYVAYQLVTGVSARRGPSADNDMVIELITHPSSQHHLTLPIGITNIRPNDCIY
jgi:hypothetical protein